MRIAELVSLTDDDFLREAYRLVLGREIDNAGTAEYGRKLAAGYSKEKILVALARSNEARMRFAPPALLALPNEEFIDSAYIRLLGRNADIAGMQNYLAQLKKNGDRLQVLRGIGRSEEARRHDPLEWAFRRDMEKLVCRETSFLRWRKWFRLPRLGPASGTDFALLSKDLSRAQREESAALRDQIMMIASALEGVSSAQRRDSARISQLAEALADSDRRAKPCE